MAMAMDGERRLDFDGTCGLLLNQPFIFTQVLILKAPAHTRWGLPLQREDSGKKQPRQLDKKILLSHQ